MSLLYMSQFLFNSFQTFALIWITTGTQLGSKCRQPLADRIKPGLSFEL